MNILLVPLDLPIYLPSHKEAVKKTAPTYVCSIMAPFWFYCYCSNIEYHDNLVKISRNIVLMLFLLSHRSSLEPRGVGWGWGH